MKRESRTRTVESVTSDLDAEEIARTLSLHDGVGFIARLIHTRVRTLFEELTEQTEITPRQFGALLTLYQRGTLTLTELSEHTCVDRSTLSEMVNRMTRKRLIEKSAHDSDGRSSEVSLAPAGKAILLQIVKKALRQQQIILAPLPKSERAQFIRNMKLIADAKI